jgi:hypothetical protein
MQDTKTETRDQEEDDELVLQVTGKEIEIKKDEEIANLLPETVNLALKDEQADYSMVEEEKIVKPPSMLQHKLELEPLA